MMDYSLERTSSVDQMSKYRLHTITATVRLIHPTMNKDLRFVLVQGDQMMNIPSSQFQEVLQSSTMADGNDNFDPVTRRP